jgi:hypothetical protein
MMKSMKLLPDAAITAKTSNDTIWDSKGKRKALDDGDESHATKRMVRGENFEDEDAEDQDDSGNNQMHAMQTEH